MVDDFEDFYASISNDINRYLLATNAQSETYNWKNYISFILSLNPIKIIPFSFEELMHQLLSGMIVRENNKVGIFYNQKLPIGRQNFTICHEIIHFKKHQDYSQNFQQLFDTIAEESPGYDIKEREADMGASIIMCPDIIILDYLNSNKSFAKMATELEMTEAALYRRLTQFVEFKTKRDNEYARGLVNQFRYQGKKTGLRWEVFDFGGNVKKQIQYDYENAL